jgi:GNAT superfamily N-acetyltransferase
MTVSGVTIRVGEASDAVGIGLVHVRSWQAIYQGLFPQEYLHSLDPVQRSQGWQHYFEGRPHDRQSLLVADIAGSVVGFVLVGPSRDEDAVGDGELRAIYLLPDRWGQGLSRDLVAAALTALGGFGFPQATLWVLDRNQRARRFYTAAGWSHDGTAKQDDSFGFPITEVRYRRNLA